MKKNKILTGCALAMAGVMALTGCGAATTADNATAQQNTEKTIATENADTANQENSGSESGDVKEVTFWYSWTDKIQENNIALTDEFNQTVGKEKGIHVIAEYQGSYDDLHQKLQAAYVAGDTPDVTVMEIASIKKFAQNGVLQPLDEYIAKDNVDMKDFQAGLMENSYVDGACYGIPYLRSTPLMYANKTMLDEAGLKLEDLKTWDDLKSFIQTVHEKTGKYGMSMYSYDWLFEAYMMEHGTSVLSEDETTTNMNSQEAKDIINFFNELIADGSIHAMLTADKDKLTVDIINQNCAIWMQSTGDLTYNLQNAEENGYELGAAFIPMDKNYGVTSGGCNLIMSSSISDEQKDAAWEFIKWLTETEQTAKASTNTGYLPSRISATDSEQMNTLYQSVPQFKVALEQLSYAKGRPMNPGYAEASKEVQNTLDAIWVNGEDVDQSLQALEEKMNMLLAQ